MRETPTRHTDACMQWLAWDVAGACTCTPLTRAEESRLRVRQALPAWRHHVRHQIGRLRCALFGHPDDWSHWGHHPDEGSPYEFRTCRRCDETEELN